MTLTNIRLGDYILKSTQNNKSLEYGTEFIAGVNTSGVFSPPKGNTDGVNLQPYKIVKNGAFVYNPTRLELGSIAYRTDGLCIVSHLYMVFYLTEEGKKIIDPMWLYMYFRRPEFCREVSFRNFGSQRPEFNLDDMSDISKFSPSLIIKQLEINSSKNRTCSFPAYGSPLLLLNILVIYDFVTAPNINMDIRVNDSVIPYFIEPFQFKTSSLTPSIQPFKRYI